MVDFPQRYKGNSLYHQVGSQKLTTPTVTRRSGRTNELKGYSGLFCTKGSQEPIEVMQLKKEYESDESPETIRRDLESLWKERGWDDNNVDEVVFRDEKTNKLVVLVADEISGSVAPGDHVDIGGFSGEVMSVDDEWNEDRVRAGVIVGAGLAAGGVGAVVGLAFATAVEAGAAVYVGAGLAFAGAAGGAGGSLAALGHDVYVSNSERPPPLIYLGKIEPEGAPSADEPKGSGLLDFFTNKNKS